MTTRFDPESAKARCRAYRRRILDISQTVSALHIAPAFSCIEIVDAIYHGLKRQQDVFIMSKGHGCMAQYVVLEDLGTMPRHCLDTYCTPDGILGSHPDFGAPGISASTGSLGHGLGIAVGQAYAEKIKRSDVIIYCLLSDGELQEGSTWEAMMMAGNLRLHNLVAIVDNNDFGGLDRMSDKHPAFYPLRDKTSAFGWFTAECDGHDSSAIIDKAGRRGRGRPLFIVCKTIKGKGVSYMEHVPLWHYRSPNPEEYQQAVSEIEAAA